MASIKEVEKLALDLPEIDRASLITALLCSLPPVLQEADEGLAEALRRDAELESDSNFGMTLSQLDRRIADRR